MNKQKLPPLLFQKQNGKVYLTVLQELSNAPSSSAGQQLVPPPASAGPVGGGLIARASGKAPPGCGHFPVENPSSSQEKALGPPCSTPASALTEPPSSFRWWPPPGNTLSTILMMFPRAGALVLPPCPCFPLSAPGKQQHPANPPVSGTEGPLRGVIGSGSRELAAFWSFNEVQEDRAGSTSIVPVSFAVSASCVPESSPAGDDKPTASDAMAVAKQQVMKAIAEIRLLKAHLRRAIFCAREINLQVYGFLLGTGDQVLKCFGLGPARLPDGFALASQNLRAGWQDIRTGDITGKTTGFTAKDSTNCPPVEKPKSPRGAAHDPQECGQAVLCGIGPCFHARRLLPGTRSKGMHPCSPVQRLREVCVLMMLPSLQERHKEVFDARWEPSPGRYKQHHFPLSALKSAAGFIAQTRVISASQKKVVWRVSATMEITLHLVHHVDVTKRVPLFSRGIANI
ncbi:hypothetical protein Anapl_16478 [Anas platyrhynchos]|uniref:Uncharacterized protein n=1 Tax=Anas platyrhynchos TaxID=8839 RepID=R0JEX0_ANAPL|nr:hypothetical protein Anapl_16478 [Anas platyrhynchos]